MGLAQPDLFPPVGSRTNAVAEFALGIFGNNGKISTVDDKFLHLPRCSSSGMPAMGVLALPTRVNVASFVKGVENVYACWIDFCWRLGLQPEWLAI